MEREENIRDNIIKLPKIELHCHLDGSLSREFVKAKVALEELDDGQILAIRMNDGEPVQNVPRSIKEEGHQILKLNTNDDGTYTLIVKKVEDEA